MKSCIKHLSIALIIVFLFSLVSVSSLAASGKAYIFTINWTGTGAIDTTAAGSEEVLRHLWNMGYDAGMYLNNSASAGYSVMPNSKIWVISSHGDPGVLHMGGSFGASELYADSTAGGTNRSLSNLATSSLSGVRLVMFSACYSGVTSGEYGNLVSMARNKGAQCVVGWNDALRNSTSNEWIRLFFEEANQAHEPIWECFNHADYWSSYFGPSYAVEDLKNRHEQGNIALYLYQ